MQPSPIVAAVTLTSNGQTNFVELEYIISSGNEHLSYEFFAMHMIVYDEGGRAPGSEHFSLNNCLLQTDDQLQPAQYLSFCGRALQLEFKEREDMLAVAAPGLWFGV